MDTGSLTEKSREALQESQNVATRMGHTDNALAHNLFRCESILNAPLFAGFPEFRSCGWPTTRATATAKKCTSGTRAGAPNRTSATVVATGSRQALPVDPASHHPGKTPRRSPRTPAAETWGGIARERVVAAGDRLAVTRSTREMTFGPPTCGHRYRTVVRSRSAHMEVIGTGTRTSCGTSTHRRRRTPPADPQAAGKSASPTVTIGPNPSIADGED